MDRATPQTEEGRWDRSETARAIVGFWQDAYEVGRRSGYRAGYQDGFERGCAAGSTAEASRPPGQPGGQQSRVSTGG